MVKLEDALFIGSWEFMACGPEVVSVKCMDCGHEEPVEDGEDVDECSSCGSDEDLVNTTNIELCRCSGCNRRFDMWEDYHVNDREDYLCDNCYDDATVVFPTEGQSVEDVARAMAKANITKNAYKNFGQ